MSNLDSNFNEQTVKSLGLVSRSSNSELMKKNCITFSVNNPRQIDYCISVLESEFCDTGKLDKYLYIIHDKDKYEKGDKIPEGKAIGDLKPRHLHAIVWGNSRTFKSWGEQFNLPSYMICMVKRERSMARYLLHMDNKDKYSYSEDEIHGSRRGLEYFQFACKENSDINLKSELIDFGYVRRGEMTPDDFLKKYRSAYYKESFSGRLRIYSIVNSSYAKDVLKNDVIQRGGRKG